MKKHLTIKSLLPALALSVSGSLFASDQDLINAVITQDTGSIQDALASGADPVKTYSALDLALLLGDQDSVKRIVNYTYPHSGGETPLIRSVFKKDYGQIDALMANGADLFKSKHDGAGPVDFALWANDFAVVYKVLYPTKFYSNTAITQDGRYHEITGTNWKYKIVRQEESSNEGVTQNNLLFEMKYTDDANPELISLNLRSGYIRFRSHVGETGRVSSWGTSVQLFPTMYLANSNRVQLDIDSPPTGQEGTYVRTHSLLSPDYDFSISSAEGAAIISFKVQNFWGVDHFCHLKIPAPDQVSKKVVAHVINTTRETAYLTELDTSDGHKFERFNMVALSSMSVSAKEWDTRLATSSNSEGSKNHQFSPEKNGVFLSEEHSNKISLMGGSSEYRGAPKNNMPTMTIKNMIAKSIRGNNVATHAMGYKTETTNPDHDNICFWMSTTDIPTYYRYTIEATKAP